MQVEAYRKVQGEKISVIKDICEESVFVREHVFFNEAKAVVFLNLNLMSNKDGFEKRLEEAYDVARITEVK